MEVLRLRLDAPLMSFGGVIVDQHGVTEYFPGLAMLTGLFANALGYHHGDAGALERLQERIVYAARWDVFPEEVVDYHTVDLGQPKMVDTGWTTRGRREDRAGGSASTGTHQRYRHYLAGGVMTLAVALTGDDSPDVAMLAQALRRPARPLFLGRKTCLPAAPLLLDTIEAESVTTALQSAPVDDPDKVGQPMRARWPVDEASDRGDVVEVHDQRDWHNQVHTGQRRMREGRLPCT